VKKLYAAQFSYVPKPFFGNVIICSSVPSRLFSPNQVTAEWRKIAPNCIFFSVEADHTMIMRSPDAASRVASSIAAAGREADKSLSESGKDEKVQFQSARQNVPRLTRISD
jgi:hypothetical protein